MSERGSFVSEFFYCEECSKAFQKALSESLSGEFSVIAGGKIVAGSITASFDKGEILNMELYVIPKIKPCHDFKIAVLAEGGEKVLEVSRHVD